MLNPIRFSILLLAIWFAIVPSESRAAACCTSAAAFGTGRLLIWETFAVGVKTSIVSQLGDFDGDSEHWQFDKPGYFRNEWRNEAWGIFRLTDRASLFALVPWVLPTLSQVDSFQYGHGLGDIQTGARYQLINIGEYAELPSLALIGTLILPTGTAPGAIRPTDVTGRGAWGVALGASLEKTWMPWYLQLNLGATLPLPSKRGNSPFWYGPGVQVGVAGGVELPADIVVSLIAQWNYEDKWYLNGMPLFEASRYKTVVTLASSWRFHPNFTLQASLSSDIFIEPISYGLPGNVVTNVGIRYGFF